MKQRLGVGILLCAAFSAPAIMADPMDLTNYTISFTVSGSGILPTAGSFTYDPDTSTFSSFLVTWDSTSFDLTAGANTLAFPIPQLGPPGCLTGLTGGAASFALITGACNASSDNLWFGDTEIDHSARFVFESPNQFPLSDTEINAVTLLGPASHDIGDGAWVTTEVTASAPVPEPGSWILLATLCFLMGILIRRRGRGRYHPTI